MKIEVVGVQFKGVGRIYYFNPMNIKFALNDYVIVETIRGLELGKVVIPNREIEETSFDTEIKPVFKKATYEECLLNEQNAIEAEKAFEIFKAETYRLNLDMKPLSAEFTFDKSKIVFFYTSEDRVDFRDLLKTLTPKFKMRVELRQIGPREGARLIGGLGPCGREMCCRSFLQTFDAVTMKMAKDQSLSLNVAKISGQCGKLMCCIAYENELYQELKELVPAVGSIVKTASCESAKVVAVDYIKQIVRVQEDPDELPKAYYARDVEVLKRK